jgi:hypothetical protein
MNTALIFTGYIIAIALTVILMVAGRAVVQKMVKPKETTRKPLEFTQKVLIALLVITVVFISNSYVLAYLGLDAVESLSIEISRWIFGSDVAGLLLYGAQNGIRAWTWNKYVAGSNNEQNIDDGEEEVVEEESRG